MSTLIIRQACEVALPELELTQPYWERYADRHGYGLLTLRGTVTDRHPSWNKVRLLVQQLEYGEATQLAWFDADTFPLPDAPPLPHAKLMMLCRHEFEGTKPHWNCGVMLVPKLDYVARTFFKVVWDMGPVDHPWQEQVHVNTLLDYQPKGTVVEPLDHAWNYIPEMDRGGPVFVSAFHGFPRPGRMEMIKNYIKRVY